MLMKLFGDVGRMGCVTGNCWLDCGGNSDDDLDTEILKVFLLKAKL